MYIYGSMQKWEVIMQDFKVPRWCSWGLRSFRVLRWADLFWVADVSRQPVGPEYGADMPSRNICSNLLTCAE
jgi:hypothetical protein